MTGASFSVTHGDTVNNGNLKSNDEKVQKFGPHSVAPKSTEGLKKQKIYKKG